MGAEIAFLWHLHQPPYRDPESGVYLLPWVRLHATRGYLDLAAIHLRYPGVRSTVNFSPILLEQLEDYAAGTARDRFLDVAATPAADLSEAERTFLVDRFFMVSHEQGVRPLPRYQELLDKRGAFAPMERARVVRSFTHEDLRDLQVLFQLAWMGFTARQESEVVAGLLEKGRGFTEGEKELLLQEQQRLVAAVLPRWREVAAQGSVELSASPYAHPILPLLCDTQEARVALPRIPLPQRMQARDDAEEQVRLGMEVHARVFGAPPTGMWPSEGSVSPEALDVLRQQGVRWAASDEDVLFRSLDQGADRGALYRRWRVRAGEGEISMVFRDRRLSDRIGFTYARASASDAVQDLVGEVARIGSGFRGTPALVPIVLDGENPWEYYPNSGEAFLHQLFGRLEARPPGVSTCTMSDTLDREGAGPIDRLHSGSWIEGSFRIWIGHGEDVAAWNLVGEARRQVQRAREEGRHEAAAAARRHLLHAQASDWFWWFGDDFATQTRGDFDLLFRHFIQATSAALGVEPPPASLAPLIPEGQVFGEALVAKEPAGFIRPQVDGRVPSYWEWLGAGLYLPPSTVGQAMYRGEMPFDRMYFGFDLGSLFLRLDPSEGRGDDLPDGIGIEARVEGGVLELEGGWGGTQPRDGFDFRHGGEVVGRGCLDDILEIEFPFQALGLREGQRVGLAVRVLQGTMEVQRLPEQGFLTIEIPGPGFEEQRWKV